MIAWADEGQKEASGRIFIIRGNLVMSEEERRPGCLRGKQIKRLLIMVGKGLTAAMLVCVLISHSTSCRADEAKVVSGKKLQVVTSLFPLYDFARNIGLDQADVSLLLPPGLEAHSFEPRPSDMVRLNRADIFIYTNRAMEPWALDILKGVQNRKLKVIESGRGIVMQAGLQEHAAGDKAAHRHDAVDRHRHGNSTTDPHIWLDFSNAAVMVDHILSGFIEKDPRNRIFYQENAAAYKVKLNALDRQFEEGLSRCRKDVIVHGGHFAFGYLARRYGFRYVSVSGLSPNAEPTPTAMIRISKILKANGLNHLFYEDLLSPRIAETIARETGTSLLMLHAAHNISKEEFKQGVGFIELMQRNLENLKKGLVCPQP
jgi:zinc transport system substrate-binding protein